MTPRTAKAGPVQPGSATSTIRTHQATNKQQDRSKYRTVPMVKAIFVPPSGRRTLPAWIVTACPWCPEWHLHRGPAGLRRSGCAKSLYRLTALPVLARGRTEVQRDHPRIRHQPQRHRRVDRRGRHRPHVREQGLGQQRHRRRGGGVLGRRPARSCRQAARSRWPAGRRGCDQLDARRPRPAPTRRNHTTRARSGHAATTVTGRPGLALIDVAEGAERLAHKLAAAEGVELPARVSAGS